MEVEKGSGTFLKPFFFLENTAAVVDSSSIALRGNSILLEYDIPPQYGTSSIEIENSFIIVLVYILTFACPLD